MLAPAIADGLQVSLLDSPSCYSGERHYAMKIIFWLGVAASAGLNLPLLYLLSGQDPLNLFRLFRVQNTIDINRERIAQKSDIKISIGMLNGLLLVSLLVVYLIRCLPLTDR
jgi:hypothetical protein